MIHPFKSEHFSWKKTLQRNQTCTLGLIWVNKFNLGCFQPPKKKMHSWEVTCRLASPVVKTCSHRRFFAARGGDSPHPDGPMPKIRPWFVFSPSIPRPALGKSIQKQDHFFCLRKNKRVGAMVFNWKILRDLMIFLPEIHKFHTFFFLNTKLANLLLGFLLGKWFVQVICFYFLSVAFLAMYRCPFFTFDMILRYLKQHLCLM